MKIIKTKDLEEKAVGAINNIIEKSFGRGFKGNYDRAGMYWVSDWPVPSLRTPGTVDFLDAIVRKGFFGPVLAGQFERNGDGSKLRISPKYEKAAKRYAELYKEKFNKEVEITVDHNCSIIKLTLHI